MTDLKDRPEPYERREHPTVMDGLVIRWGCGCCRGQRRGELENEWSAEVNVSRNGIGLHGCWPVMSPAGVRRLIQQLEEAAREFETRNWR